MPRHWLMKSEPGCYSIDDLRRDRRTCWDGVRNYQARNFMRDQMKVGDLVLFHHSNGDPSGVAGIARVASAAYPDRTAFQRGHEHFDPKSDPEDPTWIMVDLEFVERFPAVVPIEALRREAALKSMELLRPGQRLSVMPVEPGHFERVLAMGRAGGAVAPTGSPARPARAAGPRRRAARPT